MVAAAEAELESFLKLHQWVQNEDGEVPGHLMLVNDGEESIAASGGPSTAASRHARGDGTSAASPGRLVMGAAPTVPLSSSYTNLSRWTIV